MSVRDEIIGARATLTRRLTFADTDAAGHNHFGVALRWFEECEHAIWRDRDLVWRVRDCPRVHVEVDYLARVYFDDEVDITVGVASMGRSSCTFVFDVLKADGTVAVEGRYVIVYAPGQGSQPWPEAVREALLDPDP